MGQRYQVTRATSSGQITTAGVPGHLVGFMIQCGSTAGSVAFENGSGGTALCSIDSIENDGKFVWLGEEGMIRFNVDIYVNLTNCTSATVWFE